MLYIYKQALPSSDFDPKAPRIPFIFYISISMQMFIPNGFQVHSLVPFTFVVMAPVVISDFKASCYARSLSSTASGCFWFLLLVCWSERFQWQIHGVSGPYVREIKIKRFRTTISASSSCMLLSSIMVAFRHKVVFYVRYIRLFLDRIPKVIGPLPVGGLLLAFDTGFFYWEPLFLALIQL